LGREEFLIVTGLPHRRNIIEEKLFERGGVSVPKCHNCGEDLTESFKQAVQPLPCTYSGIICGYPCGNHTSLRARNGYHCPNMVPLGKFDGAEVPADMRPWESV
jgi:hypothetical protein